MSTAVIYMLIEVHDNYRGFRLLVILLSPFYKYVFYFRRSWNVKGSLTNAFAILIFH